MDGNGCDYESIDDERSVKRLKMKDLDIKGLEINSGRPTLERSVEQPTLINLPKDGDYAMFLRSLLSESEPSSSLNEGSVYSDGKNDMDPQYKMFLENSRADGISYKLKSAMKNGSVSVMYEEKDDLDDDRDMHSPVNLKTVLTKKYTNNHKNKNIGNSTRGERENEERNSKPEAANYTRLSLSRGMLRTCISPMIGNNIKDTIKYKRNKMEGEVQNFVDEDLKSRGVKDLKNIPKRKKVETHNTPRNGASKHVANTSIDMKNNRRKGKRKSLEEKKLKPKRVNCDQAKTNKFSDKKSGAKWNGIFGCDWQHELNAGGVDECYRIFLNSAKIEGDCVVYAFEEEKPVKHDALDVVCSYDPEVLVTSNASEFNEGGHLTPENEQQCLRNHAGDFDSVFRKKLMDKLGEPYDEREYRKLWNEFNKERPKVKHYDLRGSGAVKSFPVGELSPSYHATYALLSRKIVAAGHDHLQRLKYLRGFFFWLQNVAHEDAFEPWVDKSCLEVMQNIY